MATVIVHPLSTMMCCFLATMSFDSMCGRTTPAGTKVAIVFPLRRGSELAAVAILAALAVLQRAAS